MATWTTNDGRVLEIAWMDSQHLVNSFNMVMRQNSISRQAAEMATFGTNGAGFVAMRAEIKARELFKWSGAAEAQLVRPDFRETLPQMCLTRAYIDTGRQWFGLWVPRDVFSCIAYQFESALVDLANCVKREWNGHERATAILAKYAEYRLAPPAQWR